MWGMLTRCTLRLVGVVELLKPGVSNSSRPSDVLLRHASSTGDGPTPADVLISEWNDVEKMPKGKGKRRGKGKGKGKGKRRRRIGKGRHRCVDIFLAAFTGCMPCLRRAVERDGVPVTSTNRDDSTPLHLAAQEGHDEALVFLLGKSPVVNWPDKDGCTPLHLAAEAGFFKGIVLLLDAGAESGIGDLNGVTAYEYAMHNGHVDCCHVIRHGTQVSPYSFTRSTFDTYKATAKTAATTAR